jgi:hypothetical protein
MYSVNWHSRKDTELPCCGDCQHPAWAVQISYAASQLKLLHLLVRAAHPKSSKPCAPEANLCQPAKVARTD